MAASPAIIVALVTGADLGYKSVLEKTRESAGSGASRVRTIGNRQRPWRRNCPRAFRAFRVVL